MKKLFILFILFSSLAGCSPSPSKIKSSNKDVEPKTISFNIDFPKNGIKVIKTERTNPNYPESRVINWVMESNNESDYFMYFVAQDVLSSSMKEDVKLFKDGYYELLESVLEGGIKNFNGQDAQFRKIYSDSLYGLEVNAVYPFENNKKGTIIYRAFTDSHNLIIIGAVNQIKNETEINNFIKSLKIR